MHATFITHITEPPVRSEYKNSDQGNLQGPAFPPEVDCSPFDESATTGNITSSVNQYEGRSLLDTAPIPARHSSLFLHPTQNHHHHCRHQLLEQHGDTVEQEPAGQKATKQFERVGTGSISAKRDRGTSQEGMVAGVQHSQHASDVPRLPSAGSVSHVTFAPHVHAHPPDTIHVPTLPNTPRGSINTAASPNTTISPAFLGSGVQPWRQLSGAHQQRRSCHRHTSSLDGILGFGTGRHSTGSVRLSNSSFCAVPLLPSIPRRQSSASLFAPETTRFTHALDWSDHMQAPLATILRLSKPLSSELSINLDSLLPHPTLQPGKQSSSEQPQDSLTQAAPSSHVPSSEQNPNAATPAPPPRWKRWARKVTRHDDFKLLVLVLILANCVCLAMHQPHKPIQSGLNKVLDQTGLAFNVFFTVEIALQMMASHQYPWQFLRNPWHCFDAVMVLFGYSVLITPHRREVGLLRMLRALRALAPLRTISKFLSFRAVAVCFLEALPMLVSVTILLVFVIFVVAGMGVALFKDAGHTACYNPEQGFAYHTNHEHSVMVCGYRGCPAGYTCQEFEELPTTEFGSFSNVAVAMVTVFSCITLSGWSNIAYVMMDSIHPAYMVYFVVVTLVGSCVLLNLFLAVLKAKFATAQTLVFNAATDSTASPMFKSRRGLVPAVQKLIGKIQEWLKIKQEEKARQQGILRLQLHEVQAKQELLKASGGEDLVSPLAQITHADNDFVVAGNAGLCGRHGRWRDWLKSVVACIKCKQMSEPVSSCQTPHSSFVARTSDSLGTLRRSSTLSKTQGFHGSNEQLSLGGLIMRNPFSFALSNGMSQDMYDAAGLPRARLVNHSITLRGAGLLGAPLALSSTLYTNQTQTNSSSSQEGENAVEDSMRTEGRLQTPERSLGPAEGSLGAAERSLGPAEGSLAAARRSVSPAEGNLAAAEVSLGPAEESLRAAEVGLGPAEDSLRAAEVSLGPAEESLDCSTVSTVSACAALDSRSTSHSLVDETEQILDEYIHGLDHMPAAFERPTPGEIAFQEVLCQQEGPLQEEPAGHIYPPLSLQELNTVLALYPMWTAWKTRVLYTISALVTHPAYDHVFLALTIINMVMLAMEHDGMSPHLENVLAIGNEVLTWLFCLEITLKLIGLGPLEYFRDNFNIFDMVVVSLSILEVALSAKTGVLALRTVRSFRVLKSLRVLRMLKVFSYLHSLRKITTVLLTSMSSFIVIALLTVLLTVVVSLLAHHAYGAYPMHALPLDFSTFFQSLVIHFQVLTLENWDEYMFALTQEAGYAAGISHFISWVILGKYVLLALFLAVMMQGFEGQLGANTEMEQALIEDVSKQEMRSKRPRRPRSGLDMQVQSSNMTLTDAFTDLLFEEEENVESLAQKRSRLLNLMRSKSSARRSASFNASSGPLAEGVADTKHITSSYMLDTAFLNPAIPANNAMPSSSPDSSASQHLPSEAGSPKPAKKAVHFAGSTHRPQSGNSMFPADVSINTFLQQVSSGFTDFHTGSQLGSPALTAALPSLKHAITMQPASAARLNSTADCSILWPTHLDKSMEKPQRHDIDALRLCDSMSTTGAGVQGRCSLHQLLDNFNLETPGITYRSIQSMYQPDVLCDQRTRCRSHPGPAYMSRLSFELMPNLSLDSDMKDKLMDDFLPVCHCAAADFNTADNSDDDDTVFHGSEISSEFSDDGDHHYSATGSPLVPETSPVEGPVRARLIQIVQHPYFQRFMTVVMFVSCADMAFESYSEDRTNLLARIRSSVDIACTCLFLVEMVMCMWAYTVIGYIKVRSNRLEVVILAVSIVLIFVELSQVKALRALRILRAIRAARALNRSSAMRLLLHSITSSTSSVANIFLICVVFFFMFAILGVQLFSGRFYHCTDSSVSNRSECTGYYRAHDGVANGQLLPRRWQNMQNNFDNLYHALLSLVVLASLDGYTDIMMAGMAARIDKLDQPRKLANPLAFVYFVAFITIFTFILLNIAAGVVYFQFTRVRMVRENHHANLNTAEQQWVASVRHALDIKPLAILFIPANPARRFIFRVVQHWLFGAVIHVAVLSNMAVMAFNHRHASQQLQRLQATAEFVMSIIFVAEAILRIIALGFPFYWCSCSNRFDFLLTIPAILDIFTFVTYKGLITVVPLRVVRVQDMLRVLRVVRAMRLARPLRGVQLLMAAVARYIPSFINIGFLMLLFLFIYAYTGVILFGHLPLTNDLNHHANFKNFSYAMLTLYRVVTGDTWSELMTDCAQMPDCSSAGTCVVHKWVTFLYFTSFVGVSNILILNLFTAIMIETVERQQESLNWHITPHMFDLFVYWWSKFDDGSHTILPEQFDMLVQLLPPPMGPTDYNTVVDKVAFARQLNLNIVDGRVRFHRALYALVQRTLQRAAASMAVLDITQNMASKKLHSTDHPVCTEVPFLEYIAAQQLQATYRAYRQFKLLKQKLLHHKDRRCLNFSLSQVLERLAATKDRGHVNLPNHSMPALYTEFISKQCCETGTANNTVRQAT